MKSRLRKKIKKFIQLGHYSKLKKLILKHKVNLTKLIQVKKQRNSLHIACRHGQTKIMGYILKHWSLKGINTPDYKGNYPVLLALEKLCCQPEDKALRKSISELIEYYPYTVDISNINGITPMLVLVKLGIMSEPGDSMGKLYPGFERDSWCDKILDEADDEYELHWGRHEKDYLYSSREAETYDAWVDRITDEFQKKRGIKNYKEMENEKPQQTYESQPRLGVLKPEITEPVITEREYKFKCAILLSQIKKNNMNYHDVPYYNECEENLLELFRAMLKVMSDPKAFARTELRLWHPDKFNQKFGNILEVHEQKQQVMDGVTKLFRVYNKLHSEFSQP